MKFKVITFGLLIALAIYGVNSVIAQNSADDMVNINGDRTQCDDPLYDGSGYDNGQHGQNQSGYQKGDMDGTQPKLKQQLRDESGLGGMYGTL